MRGANRLELLIDTVGKADVCPFPMTFDFAKKMVVEAKKDPIVCLRLGMQELKLYWFPQVKVWQTKSPRARWDHKLYVQLYNKEEEISAAAKGAEIFHMVLEELERRDICFSTKVQRYREIGFPWLAKCMRRLPDSLQPKQRINVLTLLSSIALLQK